MAYITNPNRTYNGFTTSLTTSTSHLTMDTITRLMKDVYVPAINEQLYGKKEPEPMSTIEKIKAERREKRERARIEALYEAYENHEDFTGWPDGTAIRFTWTPEREDAKTYSYAGIKGDGHWYLTSSGAARFTNERLIDWLVERYIDPLAIEFFGPAES